MLRELTRVRDTNGDDLADEYIRVYTDLGNLEHALHGLNFGPDGRLYMSKQLQGLTILPDRLAPSAFRELWGIQVPKGTPEPQPKTFNRHNYEKNYQNPSDDWGVTGGILRCDEDGSNLEIVARGFRNPWDITFDDHFDWLGTDNDQTMGDKIFTPSTVRILAGAMHGATIGKAMTTCRRLLQADLFSKVRAPASSIAKSTSIQANTTMSFSLAIGSIEKFSSIARSGTEHGANQIATSWKSLPMQEVGAAWH